MKSSPDSVSWLAPEPGPGPGREAVAIFPSGSPVEKEKEAAEAWAASRTKAIKVAARARATVLAKPPNQGFAEAGREGSTVRFKAHGGLGSVVDIRAAEGFLPGRMGRGSVHHVAFRAANDADQGEMARKLVQNHALHPTEQKDRQYFRSIYFREPGGVLFEIATDEPGFAIDETLATLGTQLKLPKFLEPRRKDLEAILPSLEITA